MLSQYGTQISVREGRYFIKNKEHESYVPFHKVKSIILHSATALTYEVIKVAIDNNIEILFVDKKGFPFSRVWSNQFGSITTIRKNQLIFSSAPEGVEWIRETLSQKGTNQLLVLDLITHLTNQPNAVQTNKSKILLGIEKIKAYENINNGETFASFRGFEGSMSRNYFQALSNLIPEKYKFDKRSQHPAFDGFNCLLNYAYGMLYGTCESALIKAGIDPYIGIMHRDEYNRPVFVYDFIEQFRHWADYVVCHLCIQGIIDTDFFDISESQDGRHSEKPYLLNSIGKRILIQSFNDYLNELIHVNGLSRSRLNHIELTAQKTATIFKNFSPLN
ncbi:CRISPR-associated endonuclease Cas1 [Lacihabitans lacunae]|uniref:CRISPR-associated endonuclease Cas1 n=1 Tax=Lacihabitans lacunae TaxID=1028214 RepID=A0ABV7YUT4_9BACT